MIGLHPLPWAAFFQQQQSLPRASSALAFLAPLPTEGVVDTFAQTILICFELLEVPYPMLHKERFLSTGNPTSLFVTSVMLLIPKGLRTSGLPVPGGWKHWERSLFGRAAAEAAALLGSERATTSEDIAALMNIHIWAIISGLNKLGGQLLSLIQSLAARDGHLDACDTWQETVARELPPEHLFNLSAMEQLTHVRAHWINFFIRQRIANLILADAFMLLGVGDRLQFRNLTWPSSNDLHIPCHKFGKSLSPSSSIRGHRLLPSPLSMRR